MDSYRFNFLANLAVTVLIWAIVAYQQHSGKVMSYDRKPIYRAVDPVGFWLYASMFISLAVFCTGLLLHGLISGEFVQQQFE